MLTDEVKTALRVSTDDTAINAEIDNLVSEAESDLKTTGIKCDKGSYDPLVKGAIILYCRSRFGLDNPDSEKFYQSYERLKQKLMNTEEFRTDKK